MRLNRFGFSRYITLDWLNETARLTIELDNPDGVKETLNQIIFEIEGNEAKRKTIDVLTRTWTRVEKEHIDLQRQALELFLKAYGRERIILHWGMLILAYPIFHDVTEQIGRLSNLQGYTTVNQVTRSIKKDWGDRTTLNRTVGRIFQSIQNWKILQQNEKKYTPTPKQTTIKTELETWLLTTLLTHYKPKPINYQDLITHPTLFPFQTKTTQRQLRDNPNIETISQGSNIDLIKIK